MGQRHPLAGAAGRESRSLGGPPSDAIVLFDGKDLSKWNDADQWQIKDGYATGGGNDIRTKQAFGDCQLHLEWATPAKVEGEGQGRGNSGVFMMGLYEVQILDSYQNKTYFDGQAAAIYKQHPPLVNACRKPGEWQTYDIIFEAPRFDRKASSPAPAFITVLQNGVLVQNHFEIQGITAWDRAEVHGPCDQVADFAAIPRQPGAVPQHLDSRVAPLRRPAAAEGHAEAVERSSIRFGDEIEIGIRPSIGRGSRDNWACPLCALLAVSCPAT